MKFLIIGDLHGHKPKLHYKNFDAIIAPGDFCSDAPRTYMFEAMRERIKNPKSKKQWYDITGKRKAKTMIQQSLKDGRRILEQLNNYNVPVYLVPGNWDWTPNKKGDWSYLAQDHYKTLTKGLKHIKDVHHKKIDLGEYEIIGHGITSAPEYPQYKEDKERMTTKQLQQRKKEYQQQKKKLQQLFKTTTKPTILLSHNVPFNTPLDKITNKKSPKYGYHYGSIITKELIKEYKPLVCIGGHMHEHFKKCKVGTTTAINAGFGPEVNVYLELNKNNIKKLTFHGKTAA